MITKERLSRGGLFLAVVAVVMLSWLAPLDIPAIDSQLSAMAPDIKATSDNLENVSVAVGQDAAKLSATFIAVSGQAIEVRAGAAKTLERLKTLDSPQAMKELRAGSDNLRRVEEQVRDARYIGTVLLVVGLLVAAWCFLTSLSILTIARSLILVSAGLQND